MVPIWALTLLVGGSLVAVLVMLAVRHYWAPEGFLNDPVPPAGIFGVLGVALAVLLAFVLFLAFEGFVHAQDGASQEAVAVQELLRATKLFPEPQHTELRGELVCYGRAVISDEWPKMATGRESQLVENWLVTIETTVDGTPVSNARTQVALSHWLDEMTQRREGRRARLAEASTSIPWLVWLMLILGASVTVLYLIVFADRRERWWIQGAMMGSIAGMVVSTLLVIHFLDNPFTPGGTYIAPTEMQTTLRLFDRQLALAQDTSVSFPCNARGGTT
jgi:multisubunit Na+/H+ antiporter MnhB subunit